VAVNLPGRIVSRSVLKSDASRFTVAAARIVIRVVGVAALLAILVVSLGGLDQPLRSGTPSPPTTGTTLDGQPFDLSKWRGHVVVVNVWAAWCVPCLQEMPMLARAAVRWDQEAVRFVGLAAESRVDEVERIVRRYELPYPNVPVDGATQLAWNAKAFPSTFILRTDGSVAWSTSGMLTNDALDAAITDALRQAP
jgi:cytochrome c biogenesis protein CcmG/thiol:disulfide interchange protein DsbE